MNKRDIEQQKALNAIRKELALHGKALCVCATGYGKGHLIKLIAKSLKEDMTMLVIVPRVNLVRDLAQRTNGSIYCATLKEKKLSKITIATKQSLKEITADLIILDEAHTYKKDFLDSLNGKYKFILGLTATDWRNDGHIWR